MTPDDNLFQKLEADQRGFHGAPSVCVVCVCEESDVGSYELEKTGVRIKGYLYKVLLFMMQNTTCPV